MLVTVATVGDRHLGPAPLPHHQRLLRRLAHGAPRLNASAIGGEYLSAASFLGVAGLVLTFGADMLWYPVGWTAGYLVLLVLVAAPLRRSGAYTLPDFAEARLGSRRGAPDVASLLVVLIGWLYLLPQFQGAGAHAAAQRRRTAAGPGGLLVVASWCSSTWPRAGCGRSPSCRPSSTGSS